MEVLPQTDRKHDDAPARTTAVVETPRTYENVESAPPTTVKKSQKKNHSMNEADHFNEHSKTHSASKIGKLMEEPASNRLHI